MLLFGSRLAAASSMLAVTTTAAGIVKKAPRAGNVCSDLNSDHQNYEEISSSSENERIRLGLKFETEGDLKLVDEGYINLIYHSDIPGGCSSLGCP